RLETLDNGKPIFESRYVDIDMVARCFHYFSGWATKIAGATTPVNPALFTYTLCEPVGVVGASIRWNCPLHTVGWKAAPAPAAGLRSLVDGPLRFESGSVLADRAARCFPSYSGGPTPRPGAPVSVGRMDMLRGFFEPGGREGAKLVAGGQRQPVNGKGAFVQA